MKLASLEDLFIEELKDLYSAENQLLEGARRWLKLRLPARLENGFERHLKQTEGHVPGWNKSSRSWMPRLKARNARRWKASSRKERKSLKKMPNPR